MRGMNKARVFFFSFLFFSFLSFFLSFFLYLFIFIEIFFLIIFAFSPGGGDLSPKKNSHLFVLEENLMDTALQMYFQLVHVWQFIELQLCRKVQYTKVSVYCK